MIVTELKGGVGMVQDLFATGPMAGRSRNVFVNELRIEVADEVRVVGFGISVVYLLVGNSSPHH